MHVTYGLVKPDGLYRGSLSPYHDRIASVRVVCKINIHPHLHPKLLPDHFKFHRRMNVGQWRTDHPARMSGSFKTQNLADSLSFMPLER